MAGERCSWSQGSDLYISYHDEEWGRPCYDPVALFEMLNLEGAQAGLSWITILQKRENYRAAFKDFDPEKVARIRDTTVEKLLQDPGIVRNRLKVMAVRTNARLYLEMQANGEDFAEYLWSFVDHVPVLNKRRTMKSVPAKTVQSDAMSKSLKKRGFKFCGSTICYAFMQATGMVNDHLLTCPSYEPCKKLAATRHMPKNWPGRR